jgi:hypothetical protein
LARQDAVAPKAPLIKAVRNRDCIMQFKSHYYARCSQ